MLAMAMIGRCIVGLLLIVLFALIVSLRFRKKQKVSFGLWQTAIAIAGVGTYIGYWTYQNVPMLPIPIVSIIVDAMVVYAAICLFHKISLSTEIATQHTKVFVQTYLIGKICFCAATYLCLAIVPIYQSMLSDFYQQITELLWLYEMPMDVGMYIQNVIWNAFNHKYSFETIVAITLICLLNISTITWAINNINKMNTRYQIVVSGLSFIISSQYNVYLLSNANIEPLFATSALFVLSMTIWWWMYDKIDSVHIAQKI